MRRLGRSGLLVAVLAIGIMFVVRAVRADDEAGPPAPTAGPGPTSAPAGDRPDTGTVTYVFDGDTIAVAIAGRTERVRLLGIDTPETSVENGRPECFGPEASEHTRGLLPAGTAVRLERDVVARDDYGRLLAYVYRRSDDLLVNEELLRQGSAQLLVIPPNTAMADRFRQVTRDAEAAGLGLWGACPG